MKNKTCEICLKRKKVKKYRLARNAYVTDKILCEECFTNGIKSYPQGVRTNK